MTDRQDLLAALRSMAEEMEAAPAEFWTQEHHAVVYHAVRLVRALERLDESGYSGILVEPDISVRWTYLRKP